MSTPGAASISKPIAVVTGASSGIGLELARVFASEGYDLVVCAEDAALDDAVTQTHEYGARVEAVRADLATPAGVEELAGRIAAGRAPDAVAINAGIGSGGDFARETDLEAELRLVDLNCRSAVHLAKRVLPPMLAQRHGRLLFSSSVASSHPAPYEAVYGASKAFVESFSQALRSELKDTGVSVTALLPGPTETNFFRRAGMMDTKIGQSDSKDSAAAVAREGYDALMAGKHRVIAGSRANAVMTLIAERIPEPVAAAAHRMLSRPGSGNGT